MLPKSKRLNLKVSFKWVAAGSKTQTNNLKVMYRFGENEIPLVGIALSSKVFKVSTQRNRAKRLASRAVEENYSSLKKNLNLVIMPKATIMEQQPNALVEELKNVKDLFETN